MFSNMIRKFTHHSDEHTETHPPAHHAPSDPPQQPQKRTAAQRMVAGTKSLLKRRPGLSIFFLVLMIFLVSVQVRSVIFVVLFIILAAMSKLIQLIFPPSFVIGADLVSPLLVIMTVAYGPFVGITTGLIAYGIGTIALGQFGRRNDPAVWIIPPIGYLLTGFAVSLLHYGFPAIGYTSMFVYAASVTTMFAFYYGGGAVMSSIIFLATYGLFNYWFYSSFAQSILQLFV